MPQLPIFIEVSGRSCVVVGGGDVAARKVDRLLRCGAAVTVIAPSLEHAQMRLWADSGRITVIAREFSATDLDTAWIAIAATDAAGVNEAVAAAADSRNVPVNVVDHPALCSFVVPSIVERLPVQIAVSTGGASPVLARLLRARLESIIPAAYGELAAMMADLRQRVRARLPDATVRRRFWEQILQGQVAELLFAGRRADAMQAIDAALAGSEGRMPTGEVYLVGAGPGDPDLLTFRALRLMQQADVVVYDRLVAPALVDLVRRDAERIYVGKARDQHTLPQEDINRLLVDLARAGKRVLRLKGGDPFIFGRGGEEIDTLAGEGIAFQVVPGITAAAGCAAYAGIPLTHRDYAQSVVFVTGHLHNEHLELNWQALIQPQQTVAVYMGVGALARLSEALIEHGMAPTMPAALVQQGTTPGQRVLVGSVATLPEIVAAAHISPPSLVIIGEVVRLHERLAWYPPKQAQATG
ncbi:MAG: uroporphyrinogen-III C-methyltransferase [Gammaproteobacteria bacterium]|nr:uroporphyrinogen-III C-methyltransferase [Gammaproteobacteria bacterium]